MYLSTVLLILGLALIAESKKRCFECTDLPVPSDCTNVIDCPDDYECYVSKFVTSGGLILYNTGCHSMQRCQELSGRRRSDLTICEECCDGSLCNHAGCGLSIPTRLNRGPYCFVCDSQTDQNSCRNVDICEIDQSCSISYNVHTHHYTTECMLNAQCTALNSVQLVGKRQITSADVCYSCCTEDYCNDNCTLGKPTVPSGSWSQWSTWTQCSVTCDNGQRSRSRHCVGGTGCSGERTMVEMCTAPVHCLHTTGGTWAKWGDWTTCSATCGQGSRFRMRQCYNGQHCSGDGIMTGSCHASVACQNATVTGTWSKWGQWTPCSRSCDVGTEHRSRTCLSAHCAGSATQTSHCTTHILCNHTHYFTAQHCREKGYDAFKVGDNVMCLRLLYQTLSWDDSRKQCQGMGGDLFNAETNQKQQILDKYLSYVHAEGRPYVWIGLRKYNNHWYWVGPPPFPYTNFANFQHSTDVDKSGCVMVNNPTRSTYFWYTKVCSSHHDALCELNK